MANPWFRLYSEILHDPKVQILTESLRWRYVALLCLHCNEQYENRPDDEVALALRVTRDEWIVTRDELVLRSLLSDKTYKINGWGKRQYISDIKDPTAAERQQRYRDNKRKLRNDPVTSHLPEQIQNRTDTEFTHSEVSKEVSKVSISTKPKKPIKTHLPENFAVSERVVTWASSKGYSRLDEHLENFISAAKRGVYSYGDWDEAFMEAIRKDWAKLGTSSKTGSWKDDPNFAGIKQ